MNTAVTRFPQNVSTPACGAVSKRRSLLSSVRRCSGCALVLLVATLPGLAHAGAPPVSSQAKTLPPLYLPPIILPPVDVAAELAADAKAGRQTPRRFAVPYSVELSPTNCGTWEQLPEGRLWRLRVASTNATDLNFGFTHYRLPEGATLYVMCEDGSYYQGPYTAEDHTPEGQLWTAVVPGEAAIVELFVPAQAKEEPTLLLTQIAAGYRDFFHNPKGASTPKAEGTCNNDVICPVGDPWRNEIRSVAVYTVDGAWTCTGTLIMDAPGDFRPFFLTANHCGLDSGNASTVVVYWNYQSATCGTHGPGSLAQNQSGATFRAAEADVDFALIELNARPNSSFQVYYSGWDRSGVAPSGCVGIHHPDCDVKAISFCTVPLTTTDSCIGSGVNTHWFVNWSSGVTEPGSSGSGIWDTATHKLVGTLSGGNSACGGSDLTDCYGKFSLGWASGTSVATRLKDWLDPLSTGVTSVAGSDQMSTAVVIPVSTSLVAEGCPGANNAVDPGEVVTMNFFLKDTGTAPTTNLVATLLATNGVTSLSSPQPYGALVAGGAAVGRAFTFIATGTCGGTSTPMLQLQDGTKNLGAVPFNLTFGKQIVSTFFSQNFDGVAAPALPAGWATSGNTLWVTATGQRDTVPNSAFVTDLDSISDNLLTSPAIFINNASSQLSFRHYYNTESGYDGCVVEISISGGAFTDIVTAGGSSASNAYNSTISSSYGNPLGGRAAWSGDSGGFVTSVMNLPASAAGNNIQLRWRLGSDRSVGGTGWYVDSIAISRVSYECCSGAPAPTIAVAGFDTNNHPLLSIAGGTGYSYAVLGSTNLSDWVPLGTNRSPFIFIDSNPPAFPQRFYRTRYP